MVHRTLSESTLCLPPPISWQGETSINNSLVRRTEDQFGYLGGNMRLRMSSFFCLMSSSVAVMDLRGRSKESEGCWGFDFRTFVGCPWNKKCLYLKFTSTNLSQARAKLAPDFCVESWTSLEPGKDAQSWGTKTLLGQVTEWLELSQAYHLQDNSYTVCFVCMMNVQNFTSRLKLYVNFELISQ